MTIAPSIHGMTIAPSIKGVILSAAKDPEGLHTTQTVRTFPPQLSS